jgi:hypothetical protein
VEPPEPDGEDAVVLRWDDLPQPEDDGDVVVLRKDWKEQGRTALKELKVGDTLAGEVVCQHLYHGAIVDVGAECDGCAPGPRLCVFAFVCAAAQLRRMKSPSPRCAASSGSWSQTGFACAIFWIWTRR